MQLTSPRAWENFIPHTHIDTNRRRYALGLFFILCQCIVWIAAAVITQFVYEENADTSPFLMTYIGMALMALFIPMELWNDRLARESNNDNEESPDDDIIRTIDSYDSFDQELMAATTPYCIFNVVCDRTMELTDQTKQTKPWNHKKHMLAALQIAPAMFLADWAFNNALRGTSVASCTVIVSSQNVVVFLLAVLTKLEKFCWIKLGGVLISMVGIALTALHDTSDENTEELVDYANAVYGDIFAVAAAICYGVYTVQVKLFCPQNEDLYKIQLLMGYIGLVVLVPCLPFAAYMIYDVRDNFTWSILGCIVAKGLLDFVLTDYLLFRSVVLTSATTATVGNGLTIPMAFVADLIFSPDYVISIYSVIGALSVGAGFLSVSLSGDDNNDGEAKQEVKDKEEMNIEPSPSVSISNQDGALATNFVFLPGWART